MLQNLKKLTDARRALTLAERGLADAKAIESTMSREEIASTKALREAHKLACHARVVSMDRTKDVGQAKEEVKKIKTVLYGGNYGAGQRDVLSTIYGGCATDVVTAAVARASEAVDVAQAAKEAAVDALNEVLALKASLAYMDADVAANIAQWANNN